MLLPPSRPSSRSAAVGLAAVVVVAALLAGGIPAASAAPARPEAAAPVTLPATTVQPLAVLRGKGGKKGVTWDVKTTYPGGAIAAHGKLPGKTKGKRKLRLQVKVGQGWRNIGKTKTDRKGSFAISAPLDWYGKHKVRVTTAGKRPFRRGTKVEVLVPYVPRGDAFVENTLSYQGRQLGIRPNPCKTFKYVINPDDVGAAAGVPMIQLAMAYLSYATGIKTKYLGLTTEIPFHASNPKNPGGKANLLIGWGTEAEIPELPQYNAVGLTGYPNGRVKRDGRGKLVYSTTDIEIALDTDYWYSGIYGYGFADAKPSVAQTVVHELGHAFGLNHPDPKDQIMSVNGRLPHEDGLYKAQLEGGDLAGLEKLSLESGCHKPLKRGGRNKIGALSIPYDA